MTSWYSVAALPDWCTRQSYTDRGARAQSTLELNVASVAANVALADTESETRALAALGGEEGFKDVRQDVGGNSAAGVAHAQFDDAGGLSPGQPKW